MTDFRILRRRSLPFVLTTLVALVVASPAHAVIKVGAEANGQIVNSDVTAASQADALLKMRMQGTQVVRANFGWNEIAAGCGGQSATALANHLNPCYNWLLLDNFVKTTATLKMQPLVSLTRTPSWASGSSDPMNMGTTTAQWNNVLAHYAAFHKAVASRYKKGSSYGTLPYITIHNEPNSPTFWKPKPNAARYGLLYARTAAAIRSVNPSIKIAVGPTNPTGNKGADGTPGIKPVTFIPQAIKYIYKYLPGRSVSAKRKYVNAWAHNPYPDTGLPPSRSSRIESKYTIRMGTLSRLFSALDKHPLTRKTKVWATEFGWETTGPLSTTEARQSQFIAEAFDLLERTKRVEIGVSYGLTDTTNLLDWQSGTIRANGTYKPSYLMMRRMVSVPQAGTTGKVRKRTLVRVWGRSNVSPTKGVLAYRIPGKQCKKGFKWCTVKGQKRASDGSIVANMRLMSGTYVFSVYDPGDTTRAIVAGYGPERSVRTY